LGNAPVDQEFIKLGIAGLICVVLWIMLTKSEKREAAKDLRIQLLENQLIESYGERIEAADRISDAIHFSATSASNAAKALEALTIEVRSNNE
jgi:hypothetical protein